MWILTLNIELKRKYYWRLRFCRRWSRKLERTNPIKEIESTRGKYEEWKGKVSHRLILHFFCYFCMHIYVNVRIPIIILLDKIPSLDAGRKKKGLRRNV